MKTQILHLYTDAVLFECDVPDTAESGLAVRHALEKAIAARAATAHHVAHIRIAGGLACSLWPSSRWCWFLWECCHDPTRFAA
ncbi:MAG: hypothetical protein WC100_02520 [Sterolibacterium sp.]